MEITPISGVAPLHVKNTKPASRTHTSSEIIVQSLNRNRSPHFARARYKKSSIRRQDTNPLRFMLDFCVAVFAAIFSHPFQQSPMPPQSTHSFSFSLMISLSFSSLARVPCRVCVCAWISCIDRRQSKTLFGKPNKTKVKCETTAHQKASSQTSVANSVFCRWCMCEHS